MTIQCAEVRVSLSESISVHHLLFNSPKPYILLSALLSEVGDSTLRTGCLQLFSVYIGKMYFAVQYSFTCVHTASSVTVGTFPFLLSH